MPVSFENTPRIDTSIEARMATVVISNPTKRNAFTRQMCFDLQETVGELDRNADVDLIVLRGSHGDFSAGASIGDIPAILFDNSAKKGPVDHFSAASEAITEVKKPAVALVEGFCMGGGWQIASACDFILASSSAKFAITPSKIGILYPKKGVERLVRSVGPDRAKYILMTAKSFSAQQAQNLGLVADIIDDEQFVTETQEILGMLLARSRFSQQKMKEFIDTREEDRSLADQVWELSWQQMLDGPDMKIGIEAFENQEPPAFTWSANQ